MTFCKVDAIIKVSSVTFIEYCSPLFKAFLINSCKDFSSKLLKKEFTSLSATFPCGSL